ncbi:hypothetical protein ASF36_23005 [Methylobacterium sp. Leaf90]|nr:hypothetical protein ASF36_23005 [Methylobacterium sp. Leaf90]
MRFFLRRRSSTAASMRSFGQILPCDALLGLSHHGDEQADIVLDRRQRSALRVGREEGEGREVVGLPLRRLQRHGTVVRTLHLGLPEEPTENRLVHRLLNRLGRANCLAHPLPQACMLGDVTTRQAQGPECALDPEHASRIHQAGHVVREHGGEQPHQPSLRPTLGIARVDPGQHLIEQVLEPFAALLDTKSVQRAARLEQEVRQLHVRVGADNGDRLPRSYARDVRCVPEHPLELRRMPRRSVGIEYLMDLVRVVAAPVHGPALVPVGCELAFVEATQFR